MDFNRLDELAFKYMGTRKSHLYREVGAAYYHGKRVGNSAVELRKMLGFDSSMDDILRVSGMFHDIGKGIEPHNETGALLVRSLLKNELTEYELDNVCRIIEAHPDRKPNTDIHTWDEKVFQDADLLDHYGSQGIWMAVSYYVYSDQTEMDKVPEYYESTWYHHRDKNRALLNYDLSVKIFDEKANFEKMVADRMRLEKDGKYIL